MVQLVRALAFLLIVVLSSPAAAEDVPSSAGVQSAATVPVPTSEPAPLGSLFEWLIVGACLCVSFSAGGYTFLVYLRRRDALNTMAALEARYRPRDGAGGFAPGSD